MRRIFVRASLFFSMVAESAGRYYRFHALLLGNEGPSNATWARQERVGRLTLVHRNRFDGRTLLPPDREQACDTRVR